MQFVTTLRGSDPFVGPRRPKNHRAKHRRHKRRSRWTRLTFGKHKGETLPQVICSDPSWFLWAIREGVLLGDLAQEAAILHRRLQGIRIPKDHPERWVFEYSSDCESHFLGFGIVKKTANPYLKYKCQSEHFTLKLVCIRNRGEWKTFVRDFRRNFFGGKNMTKERCESFFSDKSHFVDP